MFAIQNTGSAHFHLRPARFRLLAGCLAAAFAAILAVSAPAWAQGYAMPRVNISAEVSDAGDVHVVEDRQFAFSEDSTVVRWAFPYLPANASVEVNGVELRRNTETSDPDAPAPEADGPDVRYLPGVSFDPEWRDGGGPSDAAYSWDGATSSLYVFFAASDESLGITVDYTVVNGISAYKDVGELYWQYVTAAWPEPSDNVTATITLPVPAGQEVRPGDNVRAWGHGPADGTLAFDADGAVSYATPRVNAGQYAEARVVFPVSWLPNLRESSRKLHENENHLEAVLADEQRWADTGNAQRVQSLVFDAAWAALALILVAWALLAYARWGRDLAPRFDGRPWREVPEKGLPPAVIGRLMSWNEPDPAQFAATLAALRAKGAIRIEPDAPSGPTGGASAKESSICLLPEAQAQEPLDGLEKAALDLLFGEIAGGGEEVRLADVGRYGASRPQELAGKVTAWHSLLTQEVAKARLFEVKSESRRTALRATAAAYLAVGILAAGLGGNPWLLAPVIPTCLVLLMVARFMRRRTQRGADACARAQALRRWLEDNPSPGPAADTDLLPYRAMWSEPPTGFSAFADAIGAVTR